MTMQLIGINITNIKYDVFIRNFFPKYMHDILGENVFMKEIM